jgi:transposase
MEHQHFTMEETGMITLEEWVNIRVLHQQGYTIKQIARELGLARNTVRKALREEHSPQYAHRTPRASKLDPYKDYLRLRLEQVPLISGVRLYQEIQTQGYTGEMSILRDFLRPLRAQHAHDLTVRFETLPGQQAQIDWGSFGTLTEEGVTSKLYGFVFILGYSRAMYVEFTTSQVIESLLRCHLHAFEYLGGYPQEILYDNIKTVILEREAEPGRYRWHPRFLDFAGYYGLNPRLCQPYRARTKGKVERMIGYVKDNFFAGRTFTGLADLNHQALGWCDTVANVRVHATTHEVPFERLKREPLLSHRRRPLYDTSEVVARRVSRDCYLSFKGNAYSVPWPYGGKAVTVRATPEELLEIWVDHTRVGTHRLSHQKGQVITDPDHFKGLGRATCPSAEKRHPANQPMSPGPILVPHLVIPQVDVRPLSVYAALIDTDERRPS